MIRRYPAVFLLPFVVAGILLADFSRLPVEYLFLFSLIACLAASVLIRSRPRTATMLFAAGMMFLSALHFGLDFYDTGPNNLVNHFENGRRYQIYGVVADWPELKSSGTEIKIEVDSIGDTVMRPVEGCLLIKVSDSTTGLVRGDRLEFRARIYSLKDGASPSGFNYRRYLNLRGISGVVYLFNLNNVRMNTKGRWTLLEWVDDVRNAVSESFRTNLEPEPAALAAGFLIGEVRDIPPEIYQLFRDSGTLHLLAVSGSNVALVIGFLVIVLRPFGLSRGRRAVILLAGLLVFTLLSYGEPSVVRASIMAALVIGAALVQRRYDLNNLIAVAALVILLVEPSQLFNVGFQLSFVTAWGLIFIVPKIHALFAGYHGRSWYRWLVMPVIISSVAQLFSGPLIALYFHRVPLISPLANLVIVPLVSIAVVGSLCLLLAHLILPVLGALTGSLLNLLLKLILMLLRFFGEAQAQVWQVSDPSWIAASAVYFALVAGVIAIKSKQARRVLVLGLLLVANLIFVKAIVSPDRTDSVRLFSVPGGVAAVNCTNGKAESDLLITRLNSKRYRIDEKILTPSLQAYGIEKLRYLIVHSSEYDAIDDLMRLAVEWRADTIFVARGLLSSLRDVRNYSEAPIEEYQIVSYSGEKLPEMDRNGWFLAVSSIGLVIDTSSILFVERINDQVEATAASQGVDMLVVSRKTDIMPSRAYRLRSSGLSRLVVTGLPGSGRFGNDRELLVVDESGELFIQDLSRLWSVEISL